jgi:SAM-dependent methyltransferase
MAVNTEYLKKLFDALKNQNYWFEAKTPEKLVIYRQKIDEFSLLERVFGLGLKNEKDKHEVEKILNLELINFSEHFVVSCDDKGDYLLHDPWPPKPNQDYVHLGPESFYLVREIKKHKVEFKDKIVCDMGCSSGVLSFALKEVYAKEVFGFDISKKSIDAANFLKKYRGLEKEKIEFLVQNVLDPPKENFLNYFDFVVSNPPLAVSDDKINFIHRDGGKTGIEIPLKFLDFAYKILKPGGEVWFLAGDPIIKDNFYLKSKLKSDKRFLFLKEKTLDTAFNQSLSRVHHYDERGILRIHLKIIKLKKLF